ncbi:hypothetical protein FCT18_04655 [Lysinibacillus sphaericus]|uniref:DUF6946 domain-containing protein n=1 Tax=Lysinibacillus sphaericus TaxID=1421 RepID=A0A2S0K0T4_LYSSH|nr:hypothetical protein [Lysinibacillus sphaericus]AVK96946.1 hypothetical protein LS41612_12070 [Lysinibacillus sphaericus]MED4542221.1 hypothetical protein [Lysinibacillus sphaericus]TKI20489.1 hypothetical protein FCT18_04655 [Lysinibacillus sphaericus]SUV17210.1 Uncharacterised protein [Lysinibacillus sphaericus]GEC81824.1 hypothetical protein LSP03_15670 [Lysinibacillus sphaericus]
MGKFFVPSKGILSWKEYLADPLKQWKKGCSAFELAVSWENANNLPYTVDNVFKNSNITLFHNIEVLFGFPEYKVALPGGNASSQTDLYILAKAHNELIPMMIEGKVAEPFGKTVDSWLGDNPSEGKRKRLAYLLQLFALEEASVKKIRYQLLHRAASALIEANRVNAHNALILVHSFSKTAAWFEDFVAFVELFHISPKQNTIVGPIQFNHVNLYFSWITDVKSI